MPRHYRVFYTCCFFVFKITYICRYEAIEEGDENYAVEYEDNLFVFKDEQCLKKFLQQPDKYKTLNLPKKLPPKKLKLKLFCVFIKIFINFLLNFFINLIVYYKVYKRSRSFCYVKNITHHN